MFFKRYPEEGLFRRGYRPARTDSVLLDFLDLGDRQLAVFLVQGSGHFDFLGLAADFLVETLGDVTGELVGGGLVAVLDLDNILALIGLFEGRTSGTCLRR